MSYFRIAPGETSVRRLRVRILKDDGKVNTSLVYNSAGLTISYQRDDGAPVSIALAALASSWAAYSPGGFVHVGAGVYRLDPPNAAIASGASDLQILIPDATDINADPCHVEFDQRLNTYVSGTRLASDVTAIASSSDAAYGLFTAGSAYYNNGYFVANAVRWGGAVVGGMPATAAAVWDALTSGISTVGSIGKLIRDYLGGGSKVAATIAAGDVATDAITAAAMKADAVTKIQAGLSTYAGGDTAGVTTLLQRITGLITTAAQDTADHSATLTAIGNVPAFVRTNLAVELARLDEAVSAGKTLTSGERTALANALAAAVVSGAATVDQLVAAMVLSITTLLQSFDPGNPAANAEAVWTWVTRTLTSYPSNPAGGVPKTGAGLFAAGARQESDPLNYRGGAIAGQSIALLARVVGVDGNYVLPGTTATATTTIANLTEGTTAAAVSHTPADVVSSTLTLDARWTEDAVGFNVAVPILGSRIAAAGTTYRVTLTLTDNAGHTSVARWDVQT